MALGSKGKRSQLSKYNPSAARRWMQRTGNFATDARFGPGSTLFVQSSGRPAGTGD
jgi:hypothetical protein